MKECKISLEEYGNVDVVELDGALDSYSFPKLESTLNALRDHHRHQLILNFSKLDYISSAALGALIGFARRARESGGDLKLAQLSDKILTIVELLGFHKVLKIHPDVQAAVEEFAGVEQGKD